MKHYAGLDLSMESTQVCIVDESGRKVASEKVDSAPEAIAETLKRYGSVARTVIETGRMSPVICHGLRELGLPRCHQSGELDWTGRITKQGDAMVRKLLYEAANSILTRIRETFPLKTWAMKIVKRRGLRKARVALARRLAVIMHAMLRDGTLFQA